MQQVCKSDSFLVLSAFFRSAKFLKMIASNKVRNLAKVKGLTLGIYNELKIMKTIILKNS